MNEIEEQKEERKKEVKRAKFLRKLQENWDDPNIGIDDLLNIIRTKKEDISILTSIIDANQRASLELGEERDRAVASLIKRRKYLTDFAWEYYPNNLIRFRIVFPCKIS